MFISDHIKQLSQSVYVTCLVRPQQWLWLKMVTLQLLQTECYVKVGYIAAYDDAFNDVIIGIVITHDRWMPIQSFATLLLLRICQAKFKCSLRLFVCLFVWSLNVFFALGVVILASLWLSDSRRKILMLEKKWSFQNLYFTQC